MSSKAAQRSRHIVSAPIRLLLIKLTASALVGNVALITLGIVDTFFISRLGTTQLAAASFVIPIHMIYVSLALGVGMGMSALNSRLIGESKFSESARLISDGLIFAAIFAVTAAFMGSLIMNPLFRVLGADESTIPYIRDYLSVLLLGLPPLMFVVICMSTFRSMGNIKMSAMLAGTMSILNILLDPFLIFGLGPFPALGIAGAAWSTLMAALITLSVAFYILGFHEKLLDFTFPRIEHLRENWNQILTIGIPAMGANIMTPLAAAIMTAMIARHGGEAVAGFGVGSRIEMLSLIVVMALSSTLPMFIGQNIGAGRGDRAHIALMGCLKFVLGFQCIVYLLLWLFSGSVAGIFSDNAQVIEIIQIYLMILPITYGAHGIVVLVMVSLNVLRRPRTALLLTITRLMVLYLPLAYLGSEIWGINGLFIGAACGNVLAGFVAFGIIKKVCEEQKLSSNYMSAI
jgi:putative MATE family efflux protein